MSDNHSFNKDFVKELKDNLTNNQSKVDNQQQIGQQQQPDGLQYNQQSTP